MVPLPDNLNPRAPDLGGAARDPLRGRSGQDSAGRIRLAKQRQKYFGRAAGRDGPRSAPYFTSAAKLITVFHEFECFQPDLPLAASCGAPVVVAPVVRLRFISGALFAGAQWRRGRG
jgi:hypothetical protein